MMLLIILAFVTVIQIHIVTGKNANLTATVTQNGSITLTCHYIGTENETAIFWQNGSVVDVLTLKPATHIPECEVFSTSNSSYDPYRLSHTCDAASNIYTLKIEPTETQDDNVTWSCRFHDPLLSDQWADQWANVTVHLIETTGHIGSEGTDGIISGELAFVVVGTVTLLLMLLVLVICFRKKSKHCGGIGMIQKEMPFHKQPYPDPDEGSSKKKLMPQPDQGKKN